MYFGLIKNSTAAMRGGVILCFDDAWREYGPANK